MNMDMTSTILVAGTGPAMRAFATELIRNSIQFAVEGDRVRVTNTPKVRTAIQIVKGNIGMQTINIK